MEKNLTQFELAIIDKAFRSFRRGRDEDINIINDLVSDPNCILIYKHYFNGNSYVVLGISRHTETGELMVMYNRLISDSNTIYCKPYDMFIGEVDKGEFPEVDQKYKLEIKDFVVLNNDGKLATYINLLKLKLLSTVEGELDNETI